MPNDEQVAAAAKVMVDSDALALLPWDKMSERTRAMFYPTVRAMLDAADVLAWRPIVELPETDNHMLFADEDGMLLGTYAAHRHPDCAAWWRLVTFPNALLAPDGETVDV